MFRALTFARAPPLEIREAHLTINFHTRNDKNKLFSLSLGVCLMSARNKVNHRRAMNADVWRMNKESKKNCFVYKIRFLHDIMYRNSALKIGLAGWIEKEVSENETIRRARLI